MSFLTRVLNRISLGVWWRILPINDEDDHESIAFGTGVLWENLLPLLMNNGLVYSGLRSTVNTYIVSEPTWKTFCLLYQHDNKEKLEIGSYKPDNGIREYFICRGEPYFSKPVYQVKERMKGSFAIGELQSLGNLGRAIARHATIIRATSLYRRLGVSDQEDSTNNKENTRTKPTDEEHQQQMMLNLQSDVENAISFALALDLDRRPRMNRQGTGVIEIEKSLRQAREKERLLVIYTAKKWG